MKLKDACSLEEKFWQPRQHIKKQRHYFANKGPSSQGYGFSSGRVWMWELDCKESWAQRNWCIWTVVLEKTLESPLDCKKIQPILPKGNQSWIFIGKTDAKAETPILWPPDTKLTHLKRPWCWERLKAGGEGDNGGWDGWMASLTWWTWIWASSWTWWRTGKPGMLQSIGLQRVRHDWVTELSWTPSMCVLVRFSSEMFREGNGTSLQYSCLENPRDGGAWWAAVYGVTQSQTWMKWLSSSSSIWNANGGNGGMCCL